MFPLKRSEIPEGLLRDLKSNYKVSLKHYGNQVDSRCTSKLSNYQQDINQVIQQAHMVNGQGVLRTGKGFQTYIIRGIWTENSVEVYSVIPGGLVIPGEHVTKVNKII